MPPGRDCAHYGGGEGSVSIHHNLITPRRTGIDTPKRRLYENLEMDQGETCDMTAKVVPLDTDLEVLLINSCKIDAVKVQNIIDEFMIDRGYATIFCMTETKVEGHDFQPEGIKMFSKHRRRSEKKGGGGLSPGI